MAIHHSPSNLCPPLFLRLHLKGMLTFQKAKPRQLKACCDSFAAKGTRDCTCKGNEHSSSPAGHFR